MAHLRFAGRVAIVTGAGGGLGREYALLLASRGASVIVNDLGGSRSGEGQNISAADKVVNEIKANGGSAVADYNSVEDGEKIVKTAIDSFGRIDILINNAGILRDKSFLKITDNDWDLIHRVHLRGSFSVSRAVWPYFREQNYGRIVMTSSPAGIYGNFGQSNYSSAKLALLALSNTLSVEGKKYQIHCNTIVPVAASRLTEDILPQNLFERLNPAYVAPVVAFLCHETCPETGGVFEAAGGFVGKYRWQRSKGKVFTDTLTPELVRDSWDQITNMENSTHPLSTQDHMSQLVNALMGENSTEKASNNDSDTSNTEDFNYSADDVILYALSVGVSTRESEHLRYIYECDESFSVLPTYGVIPAMKSIFDSIVLQNALKEHNINFDPTKVLHGEQYIEVLNPIPTSGTLISKPQVLDVLDKGSGAIAITEVMTHDERGTPIFYNQFSLFMVGSGNFGGKRNSENGKIVPVLNPPNRTPDATIYEQTSFDQAALYRLCGDKNPLHIDPNFAAVGGFSTPILHGLCTLGYATRHVLKQYANYDSTRLKSVKVRFSGVIIPGQTIQTDMWRDGNRIYFRCLAKETGKTVISGAYIDLIGIGVGSERMENYKLIEEFNEDFAKHENSKFQDITESYERTPLNIYDDCDDTSMLMNGAENEFPSESTFMFAKGSDGGSDDNNGGGAGAKIDRIFDSWLTRRIRENKELVPLIKTVYQWNITKSGKVISIWTLDLKNGNGDVYRGTPKTKADCTLTIDDEMAVNVFEGREDAMRAFMTGKLKISGNILAAQKLQQLWAEEAPQGAALLDEQFVSETSQVSSDDSVPLDDTALFESIPTSGLKCDILFNVFKNRMHEEKDLIRRLRVTFQFNITKDGKHMATWTADNKSTPDGEVYRSAPKHGKSDCTVTVEDDDFLKLMIGKLNPQRAFMMGKLKIKGNIMLLQKLNSLWLEIQKAGRTPELPLVTDLMVNEYVIPGLRSEPMIVELIQRLVRMPQLVSQIPHSILFDITKDGKSAAKYTLDFTENAASGIFSRGDPKNGHPKCTLTMDDDDFVRLTFNRIKLQDGIESGRIRLDGDSNIPAKLSILFTTPTTKAKL